MKKLLPLNEGAYVMGNDTVLLSEREYRKIKDESDLMCVVVTMINDGEEPEEIVSYIKKQFASWVFGKL